MRNKILLTILPALLCLLSHAQITTYSFSATNGTYTPISGTTITTSALTDGVSAILPIGFNFLYDGNTYTEFGASTNGKIRLGAVLTAAEETQSSTPSNHPERPIIGPLWDHLKLSSASGLSYILTGTAPSRILTIQWAQVYWPAFEIAPAIEFQVKLYETSNKIEFIYKPLAGTTFGAGGFIAITALGLGNGNYLALTNTGVTPSVSSTSMAILSVRPTNGRTYTFTPPPVCITPPTAGTTVSSIATLCSGFNFNLTVTGASQGLVGLSYQWQSSSDGNTWQNISGATAVSLTTNHTSATYYRRGITCNSVTTYSTPVQVGVGSATTTYASLPYFQDFNNEWLSNCATRELPSLNWKNTPLTGDRSWRRDDDYVAGGWTNNSGAPSTVDNPTHSARFHVRDEFSGPASPSSGDLDLYVDCSAAGTKELRFRHLQSRYYELLTLQYSTDGGANFTTLGKVRGVSLWRYLSFVIPSNSPNTIIRFHGTSQSFSASGDICIDDVQVFVSNCLFPTGLNLSSIQQTGVTANWDASSGVTGYEYAVNQSPVPPASGTFTSVNSATISGLTSKTDYYLHVRVKCDASTFSNWTSKFFTTSMDCGTAVPIVCGTPLTYSIPDDFGGYDLFESDPDGSCGRATLGVEKLLIFRPQVTGPYSLKINATTASNSVYYSIKDAAGSCSPVGWTCIGTTISPTTLPLGTLTAGKEYFILADGFTIFGRTETIEILCPAPNTDCVDGTITPASVMICSPAGEVLTTSGGTSYQWFKNGVAINGATQATYTALQAGTYTVSITNGTCTKLATNASVVTEPNAPTASASGATSFCQGGTVTLTSSAATGNQWYKDGVAINGATNTTFAADQPGSYTVTTTGGNCTSPFSNSVTVTVYPIPVAPTISANGNTTICEPNTVGLSVPATANTTYQWYRNTSIINGATNATYNASQSGSYTVIIKVNGCTAPVSAATAVTVNPLPAAPSITAAGPTTFCAGGTVQLNANNVAGASYLWYNNDVLINGANAQGYLAPGAGFYTARVTVNGCTSNTSNMITVNTNPNPAVPVITPSGNAAFCEGGNIQLVTTQHPNVTYQWMKDGVNINNTNSNTYTANAAGSYTVKLTIATTCFSVSLPTLVAVNPIPPKPTISANGGTLSSSSTSGNQWFKDGVVINGATSQDYIASASGAYTVEVTINGCKNLSDPFNFVATAIVDPAAWNNEVVIFPNPVTDKLFIVNNGNRKLSVRVMDSNGKAVFSSSTNPGSITMRKMGAGVYLLVITDIKNGESIVKKIIKQ